MAASKRWQPPEHIGAVGCPEFPLYVVFAALIWVLGLEGWRQAEKSYPKMDAQADIELPVCAATVASGGEATIGAARIIDWSPQGQRWLAEIDAHAWWRDPQVSLALVARRLGTNTAYLSRALNEGVGVSFSDAINGLRIEAAKCRLVESGPILDIALDVGFASKASFNRVKFQSGLQDHNRDNTVAIPARRVSGPSQNTKIDGVSRS